MKLVVWLGNPGKEYEKTRHNIGFVTVDYFVDREKAGKREYQNKRKWEIIESNIEGQKVIFLKPMEFMNRSWGAVSTVARFYKISPKDILIIHDDIDLPVWKVQLKFGGSSAWHNGLKDIIAKLWIAGSGEAGAGFRRLRIGVDRPIDQDRVADYVLSPFPKEEKAIIDNQYPSIEASILKFLSDT